MDAVAIIAVIASNLVAGLAVYFGARQHRDRLKLDRRLHDLDNVRGVLDEAAVELHRVAYALDDVRSYLGRYGGTTFSRRTREPRRTRSSGRSERSWTSSARGCLCGSAVTVRS